MFSYILLFFSSIPLLSKGKNFKLDSKIYSLLLTSALFAYSILGFISIGIIYLNRSKFPIFFISIFIFLLTILFNKSSLNQYVKIKNFLVAEINKFKKDFEVLKQKNKVLLICFLLIAITISSIGPINHPDSLDYHVGYPYQYWLKGKFFIDGGFHQALMGSGDYANLAFIQEKTVWLIRYLQISSLPLITLFLTNKLRNKLYIIALLSSSTFIQWSTIGKPLFLGEASCAIAFIIWREYKDNFSSKLLLICIISCFSIKISSLIVCTPILIDITINTFLSKNKHSLKDKIYTLKEIVFDKTIFLSLTLLLTILFLRFKIIGNFAFPLLTNIFNKNDILLINFANFLSDYKRDSFFPLNIFLPNSFSDIASSLGPGIFLIFVFLIFKTLKSINLKKNFLFYICLSQILLLILFCQGRADYYAIPVVIAIYFSDNLDFIYKKKFLKLPLILSVYFQVFLVIGFLILSISQNLSAINNYEKAMISSSYGYDFSRLINKKTSGNFYQNVIRDPRYFYPKNYIAREEMEKCIKDNEQNFCLTKYKISQIITYRDFLLDKENYNCETKSFISGARNPLNRKDRYVEVCEKINLLK